MRVEDFFDLYWSSHLFRGFDDLKGVLSSPSSYARSLVGELKGKKVLEIGPGKGEDLLHFARSGGEAIGIDISGEALTDLRRNIDSDQINLCKMDACNLGFRPEAFDLVFLNTCLMHLDRRRLFPQVRRVLKGGGRVVSIEPLKLNPFLFLYRSLCSPGRRISPSYFQLGEIEALRRSFGRVSHREFYLISPLILGFGVVLPLLKRFIPLVESLDGFLLRLVGPLRNLSWIVVMECTKG